MMIKRPAPLQLRSEDRGCRLIRLTIAISVLYSASSSANAWPVILAAPLSSWAKRRGSPVASAACATNRLGTSLKQD